jgi:hypothetical protein
MRSLLKGSTVAFPKWPARLRCGVPLGDSVSPADPELYGLLVGQRRLIKRECLDERDAGIAEAWLTGRGLSVRRIEAAAPDGQTVILAALESDSLGQAEAVELAARRRERGAEETLGTMLGYPACCIARFCSLEVQDDDALLKALLDAETTPAPAETVWLVGPLSLIAHAPCSLRCEASIAMGAALLAALDEAHPGFASRWRKLAARVHVMSADGALLSLQLGAGHIEHAVRWRVSESARADIEAPELVGVRFEASDHAFMADHRAARDT